MPVLRCQKDKKPGYKWGEQGVCFTGPDGRERAAAVGRAIAAEQARKQDRGIQFVIGRLRGQTTTTIQSVLFDKEKWTITEAKAWLKENEFKFGDMEETENQLRFRQRDPADFQRESFRIDEPGKKKHARLTKQLDEEQIDALTEAFMTERAATYAPPIVDTLVTDIRSVLVEGIREGARVSDMTTTLSRMLTGQGGAERAARIVRTEVIGGLNRGTLDTYKASGVVRQKQWISSRDARVRGARAGDPFSHRRPVDGQIVDVDQPFNVGGESLDHPGDPAGSPANIIRCRCTIRPVVQRQT